jgi:hypothetical protein
MPSASVSRGQGQLPLVFDNRASERSSTSTIMMSLAGAGLENLIFNKASLLELDFLSLILSAIKKK